MMCPECGEGCGRDAADVGVGIIYGPWGCGCGWSEDTEYSHSDKYDSRGGYTPPGMSDEDPFRKENS